MAKNEAKDTAKITPALTGFAIMETADEELSYRVEAIQENLSGQRISVFDLPTIKIPAGGGRAWDVPTPAGDTRSVPVISGVPLFLNGTIKQWFKTAYEESGGGTPPDCRSDDGIWGVGIGGVDGHGGECTKCPMNVFGSIVRNGKPGRGKACADRGALLILMADSVMPYSVNIPTTSLKELRNKLMQLGIQGIKYKECVMSFGLNATKNKDGLSYSEIVVTLGAKLSPEENVKMQKYAASILPLIQLPELLSPQIRAQLAAPESTAPQQLIEVTSTPLPAGK